MLQRLRHADSFGGSTGFLHSLNVLVQLLFADAVELHCVLHNVIAKILVLFEQLGDVDKLLAVLDRPFEQLVLG